MAAPTSDPVFGAGTRRRATDALVSAHALYLIDLVFTCHLLLPPTGGVVGDTRKTVCRDQVWWPGVAELVVAEDPEGHRVCDWCLLLAEPDDAWTRLVRFRAGAGTVAIPARPSTSRQPRPLSVTSAASSDTNRGDRE